MERKIADLRKHYLICSFGRVGQQVVRDLQSADVPLVVIDDNPDVQEAIEEMGVLHIDGRASDDETLLKAGIERARARTTSYRRTRRAATRWRDLRSRPTSATSWRRRRLPRARRRGLPPRAPARRYRP